MFTGGCDFNTQISKKMIKGNITLCGKISHAATLRPNKKGEIYTNFTVKVSLPNRAGSTKECYVFVRKKGGTANILEKYPVDTCVEITGVLTFRKSREKIYMNLTAESITCCEGEIKSGIKGEIEFYGTIGTIPEIKYDKHGNKYLCFSGFSSEKSGEERVFTWVRFIRFSEEKESFLEKGNGIHLVGVLDILLYNERLNLGCRFKEVLSWGKEKEESE